MDEAEGSGARKAWRRGGAAGRILVLCAARRRRSFPVDKNPSRMAETTPFSYRVFATIFPKASLPTNSLIHKYCFHTLGLARASMVNIT
jgi:hypothetical protein